MFTSQLDLSQNELCGLDWRGRGTYTSEGITAIAEALKVTASLTSVNIDGFGLPIKQLQGMEPVASLDFSRKELGVASAIVIASLIRDNASLTQFDVKNNALGEEGKAALRKATEGRSGFELLL